jgi:hypothetical protein
MTNQNKKPAVAHNRLNIAANPKLFARLVLGDESATKDIALRAVQNRAKFVGVPNGVSTQICNKLARELEPAGIGVDFVNYTIAECWITEARQEQKQAKPRSKPARRKGNGSRSSNNSGLDRNGCDKHGNKRRKAHKNKRTIAEQQAHKKARAEKDRARCKGGKSDKS